MLWIKKNILVFVASILLLVFTYISTYIYVYKYPKKLILPDQKTWENNNVANESKIQLAKRWNTEVANINILFLWENGNGTVINLLQIDTMSDSILFLPNGNSMNPNPIHPYYKEIAKNSITYFSAPFGTLYLLSEYLPRSTKDIIIVKNYYSNKYPWLPKPTYKTIIQSDIKYTRFMIGSTAYSTIWGIPLDLFPIIID